MKPAPSSLKILTIFALFLLWLFPIDSWLDGSNRSAAWAARAADATWAASAAPRAAAWAATSAADKNEFNQKMVDIIEEIIKVKT